jgi:hypothetical protein
MEWLLLTTIPTPTIEDALERANWYTCRWTIEVWHRVLKTGCRIEARQLETIERLDVASRFPGLLPGASFMPPCSLASIPRCHAPFLLTDDQWQSPVLPGQARGDAFQETTFSS